MTSFFQFSEQMQAVKLQNRLDEQLLNEMPMRPEGRPEQYGSSANPHLPSTAKDGYQGRTTSNLEDLGSMADRQIGKEKWAQAVQDRPELGVYTDVNKALAKDRAADKKIVDAIGMQKAERRGGRMVQDGPRETGEGDAEAIAGTNRGTANIMGKIGQIKQQMKELRPHVKDWYDPQMMNLVNQMYDATTIFLKQGMVRGPEADAIKELHADMAELRYKAGSKPTAGGQLSDL